MFGTAIPWRVVLVPVAAVGLGLLVQYARHDQPPTGSPVIDLDSEPPTIESPEHESMMEPAPPGFDVVTALHDIGVRTLKAHPIAAHSETWIAADGACLRPTGAEQKQLRARVAAWIDQTYSDEKPHGQIEMRYGCEDATGIVVEGNVDRVTKDKHATKNRGWILRIADDSITPIDERTSTAKENWMEWANEGTLTVLALIDLDHDGAREVVWTNTEHEGANITSDYTVTTLMHRDARPVATVHGFLDATLIDHTVVFSIGAHDEHVGYRCLTPALALAHCAAATTAEMIQIADEFVAKTEDQSNREVIAEKLAKLHLPETERTTILDAIIEAPATEHVRHDLATFLERSQTDGDLDTELVPHAEAQTYFAGLSAQLGDAACVTPQLLAEEARATLNEWVVAQRTKGHRAVSNVVISAACEPYVWAAWDDFKSDDSGTRHEVLLLIVPDIQKVVEFTSPANLNAQEGPNIMHVAKFFRHGDTIVGSVIHTGENAIELLAIANGHVVAKRRGEFTMYGFDRRWSDTSDDLVLDRGVLWHATPTGLEKIAHDKVAAHEARRTAIERLTDFDPTRTTNAADLKLLGASATLVTELTP
jgi:hypothetical protein